MIENKISKLREWFGEHELPDYVIKFGPRADP